jgi:hypothetical protein
MIFRTSSESYRPAGAGLTRARRSVEEYLNREIARSSLATLDAKLHYIPIVMPSDMLAKYPERSELHKEDRIYDCAPQLNYEVFVSGSFEDQLKEYLRGIALSAPHLAGLGATPEQIADFKRIMDEAVERILVERPDQTRH